MRTSQSAATINTLCCSTLHSSENTGQHETLWMTFKEIYTTKSCLFLCLHLIWAWTCSTPPLEVSSSLTFLPAEVGVKSTAAETWSGFIHPAASAQLGNSCWGDTIRLETNINLFTTFVMKKFSCKPDVTLVFLLIKINLQSQDECIISNQQ